MARPVLVLVFLNLLQSLWTLIFDQNGHDQDSTHPQYCPIGNVPASDLYSTLSGSAYFGHYANCNERMFNHIYEHLEERITRPRDIHFERTDAENMQRRRRRCKVSHRNRLLQFLHDIGEQPKLWTSAYHNGWNPSSLSRDFKHILVHFVLQFNDDWIKPLTPTQRRDAMVYENYPTAYCSWDGSMYRRRMTYILPENMERADWYDHKRKYPESINAQAVATKSNVVTHLLTGVPGRMHDSNTARYLGIDNWPQSTLVDSGYGVDPRFIGPDGSLEHKQQRAHIEWLFGENKMDWAMVGGVYRRSSSFHSLAIRASFILSNMKKVFGPNHTVLPC
eukprot:214364_1